MPSIVEKITKAEEEAAALKREAARKGREDLAAARKGAAEALADAREASRRSIEAAERSAESEGAALAEQIRGERAAEADALCAKARQSLPEAVSYIMERVVKA